MVTILSHTDVNMYHVIQITSIVIVNTKPNMAIILLSYFLSIGFMSKFTTNIKPNIAIKINFHVYLLDLCPNLRLGTGASGIV